MPISRRGFLGCAVGLSTIGLVDKARLGHFVPGASKSLSGCTLIDRGPSCVLKESSAGYKSALASAHVPYQRASIEILPPSRIVILPAFVSVAESEIACVKEQLERGSTVLLESGAAFLNPNEFDLHRRLLRAAFGLNLGRPIRLWESEASFRQSPYIDYRWPLATKVRDFSRVIPAEGKGSENIAWYQTLPVAIRRRGAKGTLVFLGSPLGPHLLAGDREAASWFKALCFSC